ncbi:MAG: molybdopterin-dependent oxidoreductase [Actinobacteria bacterium]|nr:molybdopterin-dependent oxidoreductase [Actinomycetota bacterium]
MRKRVVRTACRMCHGVCQVLVHLEGDRVVKVTGDPESVTSRGYICAKGRAAPELLYHPDRVLYPLRRAGRRGENRWERISWDEALDELAARLAAVRDESGPEYVGLVQGTGRPYENLFNRFANAFGTPNYTAPAHLCYLPRIMVNFFSMGFPLLPICDVYGLGGEMPACVVVWGCNITETGAADGMCGHMLRRAIEGAKRVIVVDPRRTGPAGKADHWLQIRPGTDGALALAMLNVIVAEDLIDHSFVRDYTTGFDELAEHVRGFTPEWAEGITRVAAEEIRAAARAYATIKPACIQWGNAVDQSMCNFQTSRALLILRAVTGNLDRPGADFFPPQVPGARHKTPFVDIAFSGMQFLPPEKRAVKVGGFDYPIMVTVQSPAFWRSIATGEPYRMRAVWIMGSNPLVTSTHSLEIEEALRKLEFVAVSDMFLTPTAQYADLFLPASTWLEYDEIHTSGGHTFSLLARRKVARVGDTLDDQEVIIRVANRLGLKEAFPWRSHRELSEWVLEGTGMSFEEFLERGILVGEPRYRKYEDPGFFLTPSGKFEIYCKTLEGMGVSPLPVYREPPLSPFSAPDLAREYPLILTSGAKVQPFFHGEFRMIPSLRERNPDPLVEIHPRTAAELGIEDGDWVWVETPENRVKMRARLFDGIAPDVVSAQHAWWFPEEGPPEYGWKKSSVNLLFGDTAYDPDTGSESLRSALCRVHKAV